MSRFIWNEHFKLLGRANPESVKPIEFDQSKLANANYMTENCGRLMTIKGLELAAADGKAVFAPSDGSVALTAKLAFEDHSEEALMFFVPDENATVDDVSRMVVDKVRKVRENAGKGQKGGVDELLDKLAKLPRPILMFITKVVRWLDFWGINPKALTEGDPHFSTLFLSNLGSIKCPSVYHHLNNYGTNSMMITIGTLHDEEVLMPDGTKQIRKLVDIGATLDESIGDGFYFARSLKLVQYICAHPEILDRPISEPSGFDYK